MKKITFILLATLAIGFLGGCSDGGDDSSQQVSTLTGLGAVVESSTSVKLKWTPVDGANYNIESNDGYGWTSEGVAYKNEYTVSGLQPYTTYRFRVRTIGGEWSYSNSVKTWIEKPLVLARKSGTTVTLVITPVDGAASYSVHYGTSSDYNSAKYHDNVKPVNGSIPDVKITGLTAGKTYYFFVMPMSSGTSQAEYARISVSL